MTDVAEKFSDTAGEQPYDPDDIPQDREVVTTPYDPPVKSLLVDIRDKMIVVNPDFQRGAVWDRTRKSRLVESILLNVPIPVIFLAEDMDGTRVVVDGQQRLRAVEEFERGQYRLGGLQVLSGLNNKRWIDLSPRQSRIIMNRTLRCIVISASSDPNLRFEVFERLNTGGVTLNDQELRNSIFRGPFNALLNELAFNEQYLALLGRTQPDVRLQHHEMVLRYLAMSARSTSYRPPLKAWLNDFMRDNREAPAEALDSHRQAFLRAIRAVAAVFNQPDMTAFRRARSIAQDGTIVWDKTLNRPSFELQMLGLQAAPVDYLAANAEQIALTFARLSSESESFGDAISRATADRSRTRLRMQLWANTLNAINVPNSLLEMLPEE